MIMTICFMFGKLLMLAKVFLKSCIYEIWKKFCFPKANIKEIDKKCGIQWVEIVNVLTDTDSKSLKFILTLEPNSETLENKFRDTIFEVITASKIYERFDSSYKFWNIFGARKERKRKKLRYYEIENIDNPCVLTLVVNPKEYLELLKDRYLDKKTQRH